MLGSQEIQEITGEQLIKMEKVEIGEKVEGWREQGAAQPVGAGNHEHEEECHYLHDVAPAPMMASSAT